MMNIFILHNENIRNKVFSDTAIERVLLTKDEEKERGLSHIFYYTKGGTPVAEGVV